MLFPQKIIHTCEKYVILHKAGCPCLVDVLLRSRVKVWMIAKWIKKIKLFKTWAKTKCTFKSNLCNQWAYLCPLQQICVRGLKVCPPQQCSPRRGRVDIWQVVFPGVYLTPPTHSDCSGTLRWRIPLQAQHIVIWQSVNIYATALKDTGIT